MAFEHKPVLFYETVDGLDIKPDGVYVDCTLGGAGHSSLVLSRLTTGKLICLDQDMAAIENAKKVLAPYEGKFQLVHTNFERVGEVIAELCPDGIDGAMIDLGVSSYQLDTPERGFSYHYDAPLDMRMDTDAPLSAYNVVNEYSENDLKRIIYDYGEERFAPRIASAISRARADKPIETTKELSDIIKSAIPAANRADGPHPAKRTFQAIRIEVNSELDAIKPLIESAARGLAEGGRIAIISFHSLEDRIVKQSYKALASGCTCPKDFPVCICGKKPIIKEITKKPVLPSDEELDYNPRARSAKLRIAEKI